MRFPIVKNRRFFYSISILLSMGSVVSVILFGLNLSLHFTGGIQNSYVFNDSRPGLEEVKTFVVDQTKKFNETATSKIDIGTPVLVNSGEKGMDIKYRIMPNPSNDVRKAYNEFNGKLKEAIETKYQAKEQSTSTISPSVGDVLKTQAVWAVFFAIIGIVLYIVFAFRFLPKPYNPFVFGMSTIIALFHDVFILLGIFVVLGYTMHIEIGPYFITAILTILGYSVNDSIVVLDRVRENMIIHKGRMDVEDAVEESIWQTMARSINTVMTVLIMLAALLFFGAEDTKMFVLALFLGVLVGAYSSIFLASPLLVTFKKYLIRK